jgi:hypothetical protein
MKNLANEQRGFYREIRVFPQPATGSGLGGVQCSERLFGEPDRDIASLPWRFVTFRPAGHFVTGFFDLVTAAFVMFIRKRAISHT